MVNTATAYKNMDGFNGLVKRAEGLVETCWESFSNKVGHGLINVNKEASMQLHFGSLLKTSIDLILFEEDEHVEVELETGITVDNNNREIDIVLHISKANQECFLPIELKCYKTFTTNGNRRGAQDIFKKDVYEDLWLIESYSNHEGFLDGFQLTMTDNSSFPFPKKKDGKAWVYDISNGHTSIAKPYDVPVGGKDVHFELKKQYDFHWKNYGDFWFTILRRNE